MHRGVAATMMLISVYDRYKRPAALMSVQKIGGMYAYCLYEAPELSRCASGFVQSPVHIVRILPPGTIYVAFADGGGEKKMNKTKLIEVLERL